MTPSQGPVTQKGQESPLILGAHLELYQGQKQALQREDTPNMDPQAKSPPKQTICIKLLSFVFYNENMQLRNFVLSVGKMKNVRIRDLVKS